MNINSVKNTYWFKKAQAREAAFDKKQVLTHKEVWKKQMKNNKRAALGKKGIEAKGFDRAFETGNVIKHLDLKTTKVHDPIFSSCHNKAGKQ